MRIVSIIYFLLLIHDYSMAQSDTINRVDSDGKKYGCWIIYGKDRPKYNYEPESKIEEGYYFRGKKVGLWISYYPNGTIKSRIEYVNNRPNGFFRTYYENGQIEEEGRWCGTYYIDTVKRYYVNGNIAQIKTFNSYGKSDGWSRYYYESGEIESQMYYKYGKEVLDSAYRNIEPSLKFYDEKLKNRKLLVHYICEREISRKYQNEPAYFDDFTVQISGEFKKKKIYCGECNIYLFDTILLRKVYYDKGIYQRTEEFRIKYQELKVPDGYNKIHNMFGQVTEEGDFKANKLMDGKKYSYDGGLLKKIECYVDGVIVECD